MFSIYRMVILMSDFRAPQSLLALQLKHFRQLAPLISPCSCGAGIPEVVFDTEYKPKGSPGAWSNRGRSYSLCGVRCLKCSASTPLSRDVLKVIDDWRELLKKNSPKG